MIGVGKPVEFWLSFGSPYAYFTSLQIDELCARHGRDVLWRPFVIGAAFKLTGMAPTTTQPLRGEYVQRDWERLSRAHKFPYSLPPKFPIESVVPGRMFYAAESDDPLRARQLAQLFYKSFFVDGLDISDADIAARIGASAGLDEKRLRSAVEDQHWKDVLRARTDEAIGKGVFGAPFIVVDDESFWGNDSLPTVERWLSTGGW